MAFRAIFRPHYTIEAHPPPVHLTRKNPAILTDFHIQMAFIPKRIVALANYLLVMAQLLYRSTEHT